MIHFKIFLSFVQIGLFSIGGGYAAIPLIQNQVVDINHWLTLSEFTDLITIAEMTPGPIAINAATFVGLQIAGLGGATIATFGCILPSSIIVSTLAYFYYKYKNLAAVQGVLSSLRPAVVALIASAGLSILILALWGECGFSYNNEESINFISLFIFAVSILALRRFKLSPIYVIGGSGIIGMLLYHIV
ncbi:chromate transporter [Cellulosilyticum sp. I15G10I2]|uniref:chromate transporter n=1 Tax=Cellulosilyticum sp. I15G10I2 TaxID=1892843 RepID=UPI00085BAF8C|nr:chromate transporter [Cellulosilyticum sp. I15G10I2]